MRLVALAKPIKTKHGEKSVEAKVSVPQFEDLVDLVQNAGGEDKLVEWVNKKIASAAVTAPRNFGTIAPEGLDSNSIIAKMQELAKNWSFATSRGTNAIAQKAKKFDVLRGIIESGDYSQDDLLTALAAIS